MLKFLNLKPEAFGLDINDLSLKILKLKKNKEAYILESLNEMAINPGIIEDGVIKDEKALSEIIKEAYKNVKGKKIKTKYAIVSLPEERSFLQVIQMPKMDEKELKSALLFEIENHIPLSVDDIYVDSEIISPSKDNPNNLDVLVAAMPKIIVNSYVSCIEKAGLIPLVLEVESQSIARAIAKKEKENVPLAIIDLGKNNADFIIFAENSVRFTCSIPFSMSKNSQKVLSELSQQNNGPTPVLDELVLQIKKYMDFYVEHFFHNHDLPAGKIEKIIFCGGGSDLSGLPEFVGQKIKIPAYASAGWEKLFQKNKPLSFTTALGLAILGTDNLKSYD